MKGICSVSGCTNTNIAAKGLCWKHYGRSRRHKGDVSDPVYVNVGKTCSVDGCDSEAKYMGFCVMHYRRVEAHDDPHKTLIPRRVKGETCIIPNCEEESRTRSMCYNHYMNFMYHMKRGNIEGLTDYLKMRK